MHNSAVQANNGDKTFTVTVNAVAIETAVAAAVEAALRVVTR